ncbi:S8 family peptidase [Streptomyces anthocyanicus]|uniref:S8 family peptidase n=1 Tax=Streptomyces anthocyanicus TaxID=68174 RepID=UPI002F91989F|nr:S8 family serine peptidase [Streptomyces anthocyanicus]
MRRRNKSVTAALVAGAAVLSLAAPASAQDRTPSTAAGASAQAAVGRLTLLTGDQVLVDSKGAMAGFVPADGRASVSVQVSKAGGDTYVLPSDAARLIAAGRLDRRLFDITELNRPEYRRLTGEGVPVIVTWSGDHPELRQKLHTDTGSVVRAELHTVDGEALTVRRQGAADLWTALLASSQAGGRNTGGVRRVSLDALVRPALDVSVPQIGAPAAWQAGYDGTGVKVAVLDSGVDTSHPDLAGKVTAAKNFTGSPDTRDRVGHGTHVASTVAGSGAKSGGKYKGVAPGAELLNGKVLDDQGAGTDSGIIEGMEWAVDQGAKVVNMSLGGEDTEGVDPIEETLDRLSDKALFVTAAGNAGPDAGTLSSPGTADRALTVGAVDKDDVLAGFSSRGPRVGDQAVKPDLTAPGVSITAATAVDSALDTAPEAVHPAPGYLSLSGTSQATPHVAGAAALLAQLHPDWSGQRLKAVLVGSADPGPYSAYEQGTGRVDVAAAVRQSVVAESGALNFGVQKWPHTDDTALTRSVTYRNTGADDIVLDVSANATGPDGAAAPTGLITLGTRRLTVPAGAAASVDVTVDTRRAGTAYGAYSLTVTAIGGGQRVRTTGAVTHESEMYDLRLRASARDGHAPAKGAWVAFVHGLDNDTFRLVTGAGGTATARLPKGDYTVLGEVPLLDATGATYIGDDWVTQPKLRLTKDAAMTVDARRTKKIDITVPDKAATQVSGYVTVAPVENGKVSPVRTYMAALPEGFRTQQVGDRLSARELTSTITSVWSGPKAEYHVTDTLEGAFYTGHTQHVRTADLAKLTVRQGASIGGARGLLWTWSGGFNLPYASFTDLPSTRTLYVQGGDTWQLVFSQDSVLPGDAAYDAPARTYGAGKHYILTFNVGVFGPKAGSGIGATRDGATLAGNLRLFADGADHSGDAVYDSGSSTLYRDGEEYATDDPQYFRFDLPADRAAYRLTTTAVRGESAGATVSTRVTAEYTFTSAYAGKAAGIPLSAVRYTPALALDSTARAGIRQRVPVTVEGAAAGRNLKSLSVSVSYDHGTHWSPAPVRGGRVTVANPREGGTVSFRATGRDRQGNTFAQTIIDAYRTAG